VLSPSEVKDEDLGALVEGLKSVLLRISAVNSHMNQPKRGITYFFKKKKRILVVKLTNTKQTDFRSSICNKSKY